MPVIAAIYYGFFIAQQRKTPIQELSVSICRPILKTGSKKYANIRALTKSATRIHLNKR
jgi:hypothetical protein